MNIFLITGCSGFVGKKFVKFLRSTSIPYRVFGIDIRKPTWINEYTELQVFEGNLNDSDFIKSILLKTRPNFILHLASYSSVAFSWLDPVTSFKNNTTIFLNLVENIRLNNLKTRLLSIGSSEEYGLITDDELPVLETKIPHPLNPYAVARYAQELLSNVYCLGYNLDIVLTRSFNHIGVGQKENFVIPSITKQLVEAKKQGKAKAQLIVGDISIVRDFVDVLDVVNAYYNLFLFGKKGSIYNICSGTGNSIKNIIEILSKKLDIEVEIRVDQELLRPVDNAVVVGSNAKIKKDLRWSPSIGLSESLDNLINYYKDLNEDII